jgi:hypothetical protein
MKQPWTQFGPSCGKTSTKKLARARDRAHALVVAVGRCRVVVLEEVALHHADQAARRDGRVGAGELVELVPVEERLPLGAVLLGAGVRRDKGTASS